MGDKVICKVTITIKVIEKKVFIIEMSLMDRASKVEGKVLFSVRGCSFKVVHFYKKINCHIFLCSFLSLFLYSNNIVLKKRKIL